MKFSQIKELCKQADLKPTEIDLVDYTILTDLEADQAVEDCIEQSLCYFSVGFLMSHAKPNVTKECFEALQKEYEGSNAAIKELISDYSYFVQDAISCDGRGHFLSCYDGCEIELGGNLYAYRNN